MPPPVIVSGEAAAPGEARLREAQERTVDLARRLAECEAGLALARRELRAEREKYKAAYNDLLEQISRLTAARAGPDGTGAFPDDPERVERLLVELRTRTEALARQHQDEIGRAPVLRHLRSLVVERRRASILARLLDTLWYAIGPGAIRLRRDARLLAGSRLFDPTWYRNTYKDVAAARTDPAIHYLRWGAIEGRRPSAGFDSVKYYQRNPHVLNAGDNALVHHLRFDAPGDGAPGADVQGRVAQRILTRFARKVWNLKFYLNRSNLRKRVVIGRSGLFDPDWYLRTYPDVARNRIEPIRHYIEFGDAEQRNPSRAFDTRWYRATYPDVEQSGENALVHHITTGAALGRPTAPRLENAPWWFGLNGPLHEGPGRAPGRFPAAAPAEPPAIVIPVYNAAEHVRACLEALRRNTDRPYRLIVIDDASPDPEIGRILLDVADWPEFECHRNPENLGFTRTVNLGISLAGRADVVFLNSDTQVTPGWLRNLRQAAYSGRDVATASPFSNNAGAFSAPEISRENALPEWMTLDEYGRSVTHASLRLYPRVPTTNGFCMYVRRDCIDAVGPLDAVAFPRGYGEENDFCMRAGRQGWSHVIDDATLVYHARSASFGAEKHALMARGRTTIEERYPEYKQAIAVFEQDSGIQSARQRVAETIAATLQRPGEVRPRGLYVVATRTGGTPQTNEDLMQALSDSVETFVLWSNAVQMSLQLYRNGKYVDLRVHRLDRPIKAFPHRSEDYDRVVADWLAEYAIDFVHIRHIAWHGLGLIDVAKKIGIPVVFSFHDFYTVCPTVKLLDENNIHCGGTCTLTSGECVHELWTDLDFPPLKHRGIHDWKAGFAEALEKCDVFVTTTESAKVVLVANYPFLAGRRFEIIPHGRDFARFESLAAEVKSGEPIRLLVPGNISAAKGGSILRQVIAQADPAKLELHVLGNIDSRTRLKPLVKAHGPYAREDFAEKVRAIAPHAGIVLSVWPETYCHTLTEMWACGLPVVGYDIGAVGDRIGASGAGWLVEGGDAANLGRFILDTLHDEADRAAKLAAVDRWQRKEGTADSTRLMAGRYFSLYSSLRPFANAARALSGHRDAGFGGVFAETGHPVREECIAVVCPGETLTRGYASTYVRVWERTANVLGENGSYVRCTPGELAAMVEAGSVSKAVIQRNAIPAELIPPIAAACEEGRLSAVVDVDDNLLEVPADKDPDGRYSVYRPSFERLVRAAAAVTVPTKELRRVYSARSGRVVLMPNVLSRRLWGVPASRAQSPEGRITVLYMGTKTHDADLAMVMPAFAGLASRIPGLRLRVVGGFAAPPQAHPDWLEAVPLENDVKVYPAFVPWLREQVADADFAIAPLVDTPFNRGKSGLKFLDYAALGLSGLYSDLPEYRQLHEESGTGILVPGAEDWPDALEAAASDVEALRAQGRKARDWVVSAKMAPDQML